MSDRAAAPEDPLGGPGGERWATRIGVVLAVAGSAVGLGNFLRFPGQAANHGGGAFMIPYVLSFLVLGVPIAWCEWTLGRWGGRLGRSSPIGILHALWPRPAATALGAMVLITPVFVFSYYVLLEAWCLRYCLEFLGGGFAELFDEAARGALDRPGEAAAVVQAADEHFDATSGSARSGAALHGGRMLALLAFCFVVNFGVLRRGVTRGIEVFCRWAMPLLILCAALVLVRVLTLPGIAAGLGFMWNPDWQRLGDPEVWLAAAGQVFFSLSVGFGLILCYASYLRPDDDVVLNALGSASTNELCEVGLGGMIVVPAAFLFLGAAAATQGTYGLGFVTVPAIMHFMPGGRFFGALWFGLLFLAGVTSSLSMLQPSIAFLQEGFGRSRNASVAILAGLTPLAVLPILYFSHGLVALDTADFWCNLMMILGATGLVLFFGWVIGAERGVAEMARGAEIPVPPWLAFVVRWVTPSFLLLVLGAWTWNNLPDYVDGMIPARRALAAERAFYAQAALKHLEGEGADAAAAGEAVEALLGPEGAPVDPADLPPWLAAHRDAAENEGRGARADAPVAAAVLAVVALLVAALTVVGRRACSRLQDSPAGGAGCGGPP